MTFTKTHDFHYKIGVLDYEDRMVVRLGIFDPAEDEEICYFDLTPLVASQIAEHMARCSLHILEELKDADGEDTDSGSGSGSPSGEGDDTVADKRPSLRKTRERNGELQSDDSE
jgi:hypothetical protein